MNILGIDTTGKNELIVAIINGKKYVKEYVNTKHSEGLLGHIEALLKKAHVTLGDIDVFGNVSGPGSFTGIRIGLATIKAFAYALNKKVVNVSRFDVVSQSYKGFVVFECTKNSVYYANTGDKIVYGVCDKDKLHDVIPKDCVVAIEKYEQNILGDAYKNIVTLEAYGDMLLNCLISKSDKGEFCSSAEMAPLYIQVSQAERMLEAKK